jgi:hypothetical protein
VSPVKYELGFYIPEDNILDNDCRENLKSHIAFYQFNIRQTLAFTSRKLPIITGVQFLEARTPRNSLRRPFPHTDARRARRLRVRNVREHSQVQ